MLTYLLLGGLRHDLLTTSETLVQSRTRCGCGWNSCLLDRWQKLSASPLHFAMRTSIRIFLGSHALAGIRATLCNTERLCVCLLVDSLLLCYLFVRVLVFYVSVSHVSF